MTKRNTPDGDEGDLIPNLPARSGRPRTKPNDPDIGGRPYIVIDWDMVDKALAIQCSQEEVAALCGCSQDTLARACKREHGMTYAQYSKPKRMIGHVALRRNQWKSSQGVGPQAVRMQIHLGNNWLDQASKTEVTGKGGGPIQTEATTMLDVSKLSDQALAEIAGLVDAEGNPIDPPISPDDEDDDL